MTKHLITAILAVFLVASTAGAAQKDQGVYVKVFDGMKANISDTAKKAGEALKAGGFEVLATYENGAPEGCKFRAMTIVFTKADYAQKVTSAGAEKAFALPLRFSLYEDEKGLNGAFMNPVSIDRTIFQGASMDGEALKVLDEAIAALRKTGPVSVKQIGQIRDSGDITGMGGGPFPEKVVKAASSSKSPAELADALGRVNSNGWHAIYTYKVSPSVAIVGLVKARTEGRAFGIAGESRSSSSYRFPGLDHAAAFPVEVVLVRQGNSTSALILKEMWRMKLYFQDAGNWAFMKNMGMPGQIQDEVEAALRTVVK